MALEKTLDGSKDRGEQTRSTLKKVCFFCACLCLFSTTASSHAADLNSDFAIVERFDGLQDWTGTGSGGEFAYKDSPKNIDGTPSQWNYYSFWGTRAVSTRAPWIRNHGTDVNGTPNQLGSKSLVIDLKNYDGPSRLGMYFGTGTPDSGYKELYTFYRVKIPRQQWPTSGLNSYVDGQAYQYWYSWKFFNIGTGFKSYNVWNGGATVYGDGEVLQHIKRQSKSGMPAFTLESQTPLYSTRFQKAGVFPNLVDEWVGIETHWKLETVAGTSSDGIVEIWVYDKNGKVANGGAPVLRETNLNFRKVGNDNHWFNRMAFGGNNSGSYTWGSGMISAYHIDDFILDGSRIGPRYFAVPSPPTNLRVQ